MAGATLKMEATCNLEASYNWNFSLLKHPLDPLDPLEARRARASGKKRKSVRNGLIVLIHHIVLLDPNQAFENGIFRILVTFSTKYVLPT